MKRKARKLKLRGEKIRQIGPETAVGGQQMPCCGKVTVSYCPGEQTA